jgi:hypothetical protein
MDLTEFNVLKDEIARLTELLNSQNYAAAIAALESKFANLVRKLEGLGDESGKSD